MKKKIVVMVLGAYDEDDMSNADLDYYLDVTNRCNKKMLAVAE